MGFRRGSCSLLHTDTVDAELDILLGLDIRCSAAGHRDIQFRGNYLHRPIPAQDLRTSCQSSLLDLLQCIHEEPPRTLGQLLAHPQQCNCSRLMQLRETSMLSPPFYQRAVSVSVSYSCSMVAFSPPKTHLKYSTPAAPLLVSLPNHCNTCHAVWVTVIGHSPLCAQPGLYRSRVGSQLC